MISSAFLFFSHLTWLTSLNCLVLLFPFASLPTDRDPSLITIYIPCVSIHFFPDNTVIFPDSVTRPYKLTNFQLSCPFAFFLQSLFSVFCFCLAPSLSEFNWPPLYTLVQIWGSSHTLLRLSSGLHT